MIPACSTRATRRIRRTLAARRTPATRRAIATRRTLAVLPLAVLGLAPVPAARATPPTPGVASLPVASAHLGGRHFVLRRIVIPPGGDNGWHYHDGPVVAVVERGVLTHLGADCRVDAEVAPGGVLWEPAGPAHVHLGRNLGKSPLVLLAAYDLPPGAPVSEDAPAPDCGRRRPA